MIPSLVTVAQLAEFDEVIDVRSPGEFAEDHIPGAINCPVLDDAERAQVGTVYQQVSAFEAKKLGAALVSRRIAQHLDERFRDRPREWRPLIYCWRGGKRSGAMAQVFSGIGWRAAQLDGGYRAYRREVLDALVRLPQGFSWRSICGVTGSGKSRLLRALQRAGAQVLDLEALARHRGSVLGDVPDTPQPSQKMFDSLLWDQLRRFSAERPVFVESESKRIGRLSVPDTLLVAMWQGSCVALSAEMTTRVELLLQDYAHLPADTVRLGRSLDALRHHYGEQTIERWKSQALHDTPELVRDLLVRHYDPAYLRSIRKHYARLPHAVELHVDDIDDATFTRLACRLLQTP